MGERKNPRPYLLMAVVFISYCPYPALATTYYVNPGQSIQAAIDGASYGDTVQVAAGTYTELITLENGVALIGEVIGNEPNNTIIDGNGLLSVVTSTGCDPNTILDGFTITDGIGTDHEGLYCGGGMFNAYGSPTVTNCSFIDNFCADHGGGIYNSGSSPPVTNCTFRANPSLATDAYARTDSRKPHVAFASQDIRVVPAEKVFKAVLAPSAKRTCSTSQSHENWPRDAVWAGPGTFSACPPTHDHANPGIRGPPSNAKHL